MDGPHSAPQQASQGDDRGPRLPPVEDTAGEIDPAMDERAADLIIDQCLNSKVNH